MCVCVCHVSHTYLYLYDTLDGPFELLMVIGDRLIGNRGVVGEDPSGGNSDWSSPQLV